MRYRILLSLWVYVFMTVARLCGQIAPPAEGKDNAEMEETALRLDLEETLDWCEALRLEITQVEERFPHLKEKLRNAEAEWTAVFGEAEEAMEKRLKTLKAGLLPNLREPKKSALRQEKTATVNAMDLATAEKWVETLEEWTQEGPLPPECRMLLAHHAPYKQKPELEFAEGRTEVFSSQGLPGALGVTLTIRLPQSWKRYPLTPGKALQMWGSHGGHGPQPMAFSISMRPLPGVPTAGMLEEIFSEESVRARLTPGSQVVSFSREKTGNLIRGVITTVDRDSSDPDSKSVMVMHHLIQKDVLIGLAFALPDAKKGTKDPRFRRLELLMQQIVNSLEIQE